MTEVTEQAYQDLRQHIIDTWKYIELRDELDNPIVRLSPDDQRVSWVHVPLKEEKEIIIDYDRRGNPITDTVTIDKLPSTLQLQIVVKGSDSEISLPKTFAKSVIYNVATDGEPLSVESFTPFEMANDNDQITVVHNIEVPQL